MIRDLIVNLLCLASIVGGSAATALSFEQDGKVERPEVVVAVEAEAEREVVVAIQPEQLTAWTTALANAIPVLAASLLLVWSNYRATKRRIEAEDAAAAQEPQVAEQEREVTRIEAVQQAKDSPPLTSRSKTKTVAKMAGYDGQPS